jgi:hypothetical protein
MSKNTELVNIVKIEAIPSSHTTIVRVPRKARITEEDAIPRPEVEVVGEEELRHKDQVEKKAKAPETFFKKAPEGVPGFPGADVDTRVLRDFLAAAEMIVPENKDFPILSSVKVTYCGGDRLFLEASGGDLWSLVAIEATSSGGEGFETMVPLRRAKNAVNAVKLNYQTIRVGLSESQLCLGPMMVKYGGKVEDFPVKPEFRDWDVRAVAPTFYFEEIFGRVVPARGDDPMYPKLHGVLLDYDVCEVDGQMRVLCTAVATDGKRMHMLRLPRMQFDSTKGGSLPPSVVLSEKFFGHLSTIATGEVGLQIGDEQVMARGDDYMVVAKASLRGNASKSVENWRDVNVDYEGFWAVDPKDLEYIAKAAVEASDDGEVRLRIDSLTEQLELCSYGEEGNKFKDTIPVRRFGGPPAVNVLLNGNFLSDAVFACRSSLIRLGFSEDLEGQAHSPVVVRGEDELFKAIVMPIRG